MKKCKSCGAELPFTVNNGIRSYKHKFGYGIDCKCLAKWSLETEEGKAWLQKQTAFKMKKNKQKSAREEKLKDRQMKIDLMSTSEYWAKMFQPKFNELIRIVDKGCGCIATRRTTGQMQAGHYIHSGVNKTISINAHNIFLQSMESNHFRSGDVIKYQDGIRTVFGDNYFNFVEGLKKCPALHLTKIELMEAYEIVLRLRREYKKEEYLFLSPLERIEMRNDINSELGLYPNEFTVYLTDKTY